MKSDDKKRLAQELGSKLKKLRESKRCSQEQLSKASGVRVDLIRAYELVCRRNNGEWYSPSVEIIDKLAKALECDPWQLYKLTKDGSIVDSWII